MRILVVDDSIVVRARLAQLLREDATQAVDEASSAEEAFAIAGRHLPDVVVLDLNMPVMGGLEILPQLKALASSPTVIVLTNHPSEIHEREARARGADFFFDKSKDFDRITEVIADRVRGVVGGSSEAR